MVWFQSTPWYGFSSPPSRNRPHQALRDHGDLPCLRNLSMAGGGRGRSAAGQGAGAGGGPRHASGEGLGPPVSREATRARCGYCISPLKRLSSPGMLPADPDTRVSTQIRLFVGGGVGGNGPGRPTFADRSHATCGAQHAHARETHARDRTHRDAPAHTRTHTLTGAKLRWPSPVAHARHAGRGVEPQGPPPVTLSRPCFRASLLRTGPIHIRITPESLIAESHYIRVTSESLIRVTSESQVRRSGRYGGRVGVRVGRAQVPAAGSGEGGAELRRGCGAGVRRVPPGARRLRGRCVGQACKCVVRRYI